MSYEQEIAELSAAVDVLTNSVNNLDTTTTSAYNAAVSTAIQKAQEASAASELMNKRYLGAKVGAPSLDNQGAALETGANYYDTTLAKIRVWNGAQWVEGISAVAGVSSVNSKNGIVSLTATDIATAATTIEMQSGTETAYRSLSPSLVKDAVLAHAPKTLESSSRTSNIKLVKADSAKLINITDGTFTQTFDSCTALGSGWWCYIRNSGTGNITLDPDGSETIDEVTSYVMYPGEFRLVQCDGTSLYTVLISSNNYQEFRVSGAWTKPRGAKFAYVELMSAGGGSSSHQYGGAFKSATFNLDTLPDTLPVIVGAGTTGDGGKSSFGSALTTHTFKQSYPVINTLYDGSGGGLGGSAGNVSRADPLTGVPVSPAVPGEVNTTDGRSGATGTTALKYSTGYLNNTYNALVKHMSFTSGGFEYVPMRTGTSGLIRHLLKFAVNNYSSVLDAIDLGVDAYWIGEANGNVFYTANLNNQTSSRVCYYKSLANVLAETDTWASISFTTVKTNVHNLEAVCYWNSNYYLICAGNNSSSIGYFEAVKSSNLSTWSTAGTLYVNNLSNGFMTCLGVAVNSSGIVVLSKYLDAGNTWGVKVFISTDGSTWSDSKSFSGYGSRPITLSSGIVCHSGATSGVILMVFSYSANLATQYSSSVTVAEGTLPYSQPPSICAIEGTSTVYVGCNSSSGNNTKYFYAAKATINASSNPTLLYSPQFKEITNVYMDNTGSYQYGGVTLPSSVPSGATTVSTLVSEVLSSYQVFALKRAGFTDNGSVLTTLSSPYLSITNNLPANKNVYPFNLKGGVGYGGGASGAPGALTQQNSYVSFRFTGNQAAEAALNGGSGFVKIWTW